MVRGKFKSIQEKGGLEVHLLSLGVEPEYFYHIDDMRDKKGKKLANTVLVTMLKDKYDKEFHRTTVSGWRKIREEEANG